MSFIIDYASWSDSHYPLLQLLLDQVIPLCRIPVVELIFSFIYGRNLTGDSAPWNNIELHNFVESKVPKICNFLFGKDKAAY
jgi:hypothetical protein